MNRAGFSRQSFRVHTSLLSCNESVEKAVTFISDLDGNLLGIKSR